MVVDGDGDVDACSVLSSYKGGEGGGLPELQFVSISGMCRSC